ncbi:F1F0 ATP synthase subunit e, mitochondrial [Coniosporium apollinis]|uniref:ATP synthase F(0) complex subunit e, mitochondrial n=2 Tax=Coniosporium TaxID=2810619 RepID=A0ABQ9P5X3_9PEZI|nr:F1F0 ATP synthase subunit e, mitochondrial [Cladosporium sp. JES 115]KAJ9668974.1 F1F0 ATP synthase subunit e, mitochondrial [Coniosporium apollinis]
MASSGVNVLRWSALGLGVFYGLYHQGKISAKEKLDQINRDYERKASLINEAKAAYMKKTMPQSSKTESGDIITDPMDPRFDLEAYLTMKQAGEK